MKPTTSSRVCGLSRRTALLLVGIIVVFAIAATAFTFTYGLRFSKPGGDGEAYQRAAVQLLQKGFYGYKSHKSNAYMSPGYPLFLAAIYKSTGHVWSGQPREAVCLIQILIACTTILAVFLIGRRLFNERIGLIAALLFALYPPMIVATNLWLTETLATATLMWFVYVSIVAMDGDDWKPWALSGVLLGVTVLIRPGVLPIAIVPFVVRFFWGNRKGLVKALVITVAAFVLVMAPWGIRNQMVLHHPYLLSNHSGDPILAGVDPYYYELGPKYQFHGPSYDKWQVTHRPYKKDQFAAGVIVAELKSKPLETLWWFTIGKTMRMYSVNWLAEEGLIGSWTTAVRMFVVVLGWIGVAYAVRERRLRMLALVLLLGSLSLLSVSPEPRYAFSWIALLTVPAAVVLMRIFGGPDALAGDGPSADAGSPGAPDSSRTDPDAPSLAPAEQTAEPVSVG